MRVDFRMVLGVAMLCSLCLPQQAKADENIRVVLDSHTINGGDGRGLKPFKILIYGHGIRGEEGIHWEVETGRHVRIKTVMAESPKDKKTPGFILIEGLLGTAVDAFVFVVANDSKLTIDQGEVFVKQITRSLKP